MSEVTAALLRGNFRNEAYSAEKLPLVCTCVKDTILGQLPFFEVYTPGTGGKVTIPVLSTALEMVPGDTFHARLMKLASTTISTTSMHGASVPQLWVAAPFFGFKFNMLQPSTRDGVVEYVAQVADSEGFVAFVMLANSFYISEVVEDDHFMTLRRCLSPCLSV
eukprot:COSAG01_NODE_4786_length_4745_cov_95.210073_3_plen_164_part_00